MGDKTSEEELKFGREVNGNFCAVCLKKGQVLDSNCFTVGETCLWKIHNFYEEIVSVGELPAKIVAHFPDVPKKRLDPPGAAICSLCFSVIQNVLQIEKKMLEEKAKLLVNQSSPGSKGQEGILEMSGTNIKGAGDITVKAAPMQTRAKRKCALGGLPQEIINAELGLKGHKDKSADNDASSLLPGKRRKVEGSKSERIQRSSYKIRRKVKSQDEQTNGDQAAAPRQLQISVPEPRKYKKRGKKSVPNAIPVDSTSNLEAIAPSLESARGKGKKDVALDPKDNFFSCPKCCQYFSKDSYPQFRNHLSEECFVKKRVPCQLCGHIYSTQNILDYHMVHVHENPHPNSKTMKTKPRKEYVDTVSKLVKNQEEGKSTSAVGEGDALLKNCKELEEDEWPEDESEAEKIAAQRGIWKCWICFYESKQKSLWNTHMNRIHPDVVGISLTCDTCGFSFSKKFHLREHVHEVHAENSGYTCDECGRKFMYKNMQHVCEKIQCNICGETFDTKGMRSKHMLVHPEFRPFKCKLCPKEFQKREYLTIHMRVHNDTRPYGCDFCEKRFRSKSHYNNHRRLHTGEKPYICHNCGRSFFSPQCLYNHLTSHTGNKSSVCGTCGKAFRTKNDLKRHEYIHSGEKPFTCKYCGKHFNRRGNCMVHERAHEVDGEYQCDVCDLKFEKLKKLEKHKLKLHQVTEVELETDVKVTKGWAKVNSPPTTGTLKTRFVAEVESVPQPVTFIQLDDVASNVEISEGIAIAEGAEEPISLYQFAFEIDDNTLYCIQERRTDVV